MQPWLGFATTRQFNPASLTQEYGKQTQYRRGSLVVLAALQDLDEITRDERMVYPSYMRDKAMGLFLRESKARHVAIAVSENFWYRWLSMAVVGISVLAVIWTPNSSKTSHDSKVRAGPHLAHLQYIRTSAAVRSPLCM